MNNHLTKTNQTKTKRNILVTGGAGFIGSHLVDDLLIEGHNVVVLDNFNLFYDPKIKRLNIAEHLKHKAYRLIEGDLRDDHVLKQVVSHGPFDVVVHLAAMAGVRPSLEQPALYMDVNVLGTQKLINALVKTSMKPRFIFGSSSSVYGSRSGEQFLETDRVDQPMSPYAASKAAGELLCYSAYKTSNLPSICLRFFTVFGPRQRPDLAIHKFCQLIDQGQTVEIYGDGKSKRDYTFVSDIVFGIKRAMTCEFSGYEIVNLGRSEPVFLLDVINSLENALGKKAKVMHKPMQLGDVPYTYANINKAKELLGYQPKVDFNQGIQNFVNWYSSIWSQHK